MVNTVKTATRNNTANDFSLWFNKNNFYWKAKWKDIFVGDFWISVELFRTMNNIWCAWILCGAILFVCVFSSNMVKATILVTLFWCKHIDAKLWSFLKRLKMWQAVFGLDPSKWSNIVGGSVTLLSKCWRCYSKERHIYLKNWQKSKNIDFVTSIW